MDAPLYDVYLTGKLSEDVTPALAAQRLATLFKSTPEAMAALLTGKAQLLKRGIDKTAALKYREALQQAGCEVAFKTQAASAEPPQAIERKPAAASAPTKFTAPIQSASRAQTASPNPNQTTSSDHTILNTGLQIAPAGEELLRADERHTATPVVVDVSHLSVAPIGPLPATLAKPALAPDIGHLSLAAADGNLLRDSERAASAPPITPDISGLSVAAAGAPIETLKDKAAPLNPDISKLTLAPAGNDLLMAEERKRAVAAAPNIDHLSLAP